MTTSPRSGRSWQANPLARDWRCAPPPGDAAAFHRALPAYRPTPLREVPHLAAEWGVRRVVVKDESARLGLPAFKALGVFYAVSRVIQDRIGPDKPAHGPDVPVHGPDVPAHGLDVPVHGLDSLREAAAAGGPLALVTATDGNHGRALAHMAARLDVPAVVFVPDVVDATAIEAIRSEGAEVVVVPEDYDRTVALAAAHAAGRPEAVLVQDTAWPGYETVPQYIVDGYSTMFTEIDAQLGEGEASLVVTPMGVGSLAQAVITHCKSRTRPVAVLGVEPDTAACVLAGVRAGTPVSVPTGATIMAGLNCGTPSALAWPFLRDGLDAVTTVSDPEAAAAVTELAAHGVPAGPCGAACVPAVRSLLGEPEGRETLGLTPESVIVLLSTEGARSATASA
ncbi:pyridoxal-phosphate dependent enzyme [Streptomyces sp. NPDC090106]|uniref:pyridoxal-phosphate dependent enzyme n=1 Tax=Streptomyces sp. NPDC090106 TaxID=3365946 RepID=UPI0038002BCB